MAIFPLQENQVLIDWAETRGNKEDDERGVYILNVDENVDEVAFKENFTKFGVIEKASVGVTFELGLLRLCKS